MVFSRGGCNPQSNECSAKLWNVGPLTYTLFFQDLISGAWLHSHMGRGAYIAHAAKIRMEMVEQTPCCTFTSNGHPHPSTVSQRHVCLESKCLINE